MQPIWKTEGKKAKLHDDAFDIFVWSNYAFTHLFFVDEGKKSSLTRPQRAVVWLMKMIVDFANDGKINHQGIIEELSYDTRNDKAFAVSGTITHKLMRSAVLTTPRVKQSELKNIILGGGQNLLSPERRLDAVIVASPQLFE
jgi:hypothetical protein